MQNTLRICSRRHPSSFLRFHVCRRWCTVFSRSATSNLLSQSFCHFLSPSIALRSPFNNRPPTTFLRFQIFRILRDAIRSANEQKAREIEPADVGSKNRLAKDIVVFARFYRSAKVPLSRAYLSDRFAIVARSRDKKDTQVTWRCSFTSAANDRWS